MDIGTGDGLFVYKSAQQDPQTFFIGIDANGRPLQKISEKVYRRPARGGLPNVLFVQSAVESLPEELRGIATEVQVQFPWGSLLRGVASGDQLVMRNLRSICAPTARLQVTIGLDPERDRCEWDRLGLPEISKDYIFTILAERYQRAGFSIIEVKAGPLSGLTQVPTSWGRRLQESTSRSLVSITAEAD